MQLGGVRIENFWCNKYLILSPTDKKLNQNKGVNFVDNKNRGRKD